MKPLLNLFFTSATISLFVLPFSCELASAQGVDPSVFLGRSIHEKKKPDSPKSTQENDELDAGRYVKKEKRAEKKKRSTAAVGTAGEELNIGAAAAHPDLPQTWPVKSSTDTGFNGSDTPQVDLAPEKKQDESFSYAARDLLLGGDPNELDRYRSFLDPEDIRKNFFEFTVASTYLYNTSMSAFYPRNYINSSPGAVLGIDLWFTPFFSLGVDYRFSLLNEVKDAPGGDGYTATSHQWIDAGLKFRRFFGMALNSSSFTLGLLYSVYTFSPQPNALYRVKQQTTGPQIALDLTVPSGKQFAWTFGFFTAPFVAHQESINNTDMRAGPGNTSAMFGTRIGGEFRLSRSTRAFFKITTEVYKSQFSGASIGTDPITGSTATNVPVTNMFYMLDLGMKFGK